MRFGVVGNGFVGRATQLFGPDEVVVYDALPERCAPLGTTLADVAACELVFVCVPTPMRADRSCNVSLVEAAVRDVRACRPDAVVVLRSTVPPGTSERLGCAFMPEFLTERRWRQDFVECPLWIFGGDERATATWRRLVEEAHACGRIQHQDVYVVASPTTCELIKYGRNCFLATKVAFFNELAAVCAAAKVDFEEVRHGVADDRRIGDSHSHVPGADGFRGFGGTCFPKDINALCSAARTLGVEPYVMSAAAERNETVDRPAQDWKASERAFSG